MSAARKSNAVTALQIKALTQRAQVIGAELRARRYKKPVPKAPTDVLAAKRIVDAWHSKQTKEADKLRANDLKLTDNLKREILFGDITKALAKGEKLEAELKIG
jgi:hypothetical protein